MMQNPSLSGTPACPLQFRREPLQFLKLQKPFFDRQFQILSKQRPVNIPFINFNDRIGFDAD